MTGIRISKEVIVKTPEEILKKRMSFAGNDLAAGETITAVDSVTVAPPAQLTASGSPSGSDVLLTLGAGNVGTDYFVIVIANTSAGQKLVQVGRISVGSAT